MLAGAFSVFTLVSGGAGPVLGALADRFGPRRLILIGGVLLAGVALGGQPRHARLAPLPGLRPAHRGRGGHRGLDARGGDGAAAVERAPGPGPRHRGLRAWASASSWSSRSARRSSTAFGWRWAFRALGVALRALDPARHRSLVVRDVPPAPRPAAPRAGQRSPRRAATRSSGRWPVRRSDFIGLAVFLGSICSQTLHVHQAAFLVDHGLPAMTAASVISVVGAASILGKTGGGLDLGSSSRASWSTRSAWSA